MAKLLFLKVGCPGERDQSHEHEEAGIGFYLLTLKIPKL